LNVNGVNDVRQIEKHTAESLGTDQIPAALIKAVGRAIGCDFHKVIIYIWDMENLPEESMESVIVPIYKKGDKTDCSNWSC
jgi:hypothetical protein